MTLIVFLIRDRVPKFRSMLIDLKCCIAGIEKEQENNGR